jgi:transposase
MTPDQVHALGQTMLNTELHGLVRAKQEALNIANSMPKPRVKERDSDDVQFGKLRIEALEREKEAAYQALREAQEITKEWQSAMEAWRDLAQTLRDEVKACPNHEAHKFGKDDTARIKRFNNHEDDGRAKRGLKPRDRPNQK